METAEKRVDGLGDQLKPYQQRAALAFPILVRQANARSSMTYAQLAAEIGMRPRNLNDVLGAIGNELLRIGRKWKCEIPPLTCIVVNQKDGTPSRGVEWFLPEGVRFRQLSSEQRRSCLERINQDIYDFSRWNEVLSELGLETSPVATSELLRSEAKEIRRRIGTGEGPEHFQAKLYVKSHPERFSVSKKADAEVEYLFDSGDCLDVLFKYRGEWIGVEVKGSISDDLDIKRGLHQCVKYEALIAADQKLIQIPVNRRMFLAVCRTLSPELAARAATLGIEVVVINPL